MFPGGQLMLGGGGPPPQQSQQQPQQHPQLLPQLAGLGGQHPHLAGLSGFLQQGGLIQAGGPGGPLLQARLPPIILGFFCQRTTIKKSK